MSSFTRKRLIFVLVFLCTCAVVLTRSDQIGKADAGPFYAWTAPAMVDPGAMSAAEASNAEAVMVMLGSPSVTPSPGMVSVTVGTNPSDFISFSVDSVSYTSTQTFIWVTGSVHSISTTSPQGGNVAVISGIIGAMAAPSAITSRPTIPRRIRQIFIHRITLE